MCGDYFRQVLCLLTYFFMNMKHYMRVGRRAEVDAPAAWAQACAGQVAGEAATVFFRSKPRGDSSEQLKVGKQSICFLKGFNHIFKISHFI